MNDSSPQSESLRIAWLAEPHRIPVATALLAPISERLVDAGIQPVLFAPDHVPNGWLPEPPVECWRYRSGRSWPWNPSGRAELIKALGQANVQLLHALDDAGRLDISRIAETLERPFCNHLLRLRSVRRMPRKAPHQVGFIAASHRLEQVLRKKHRSCDSIRRIPPAFEPRPQPQTRPGEDEWTVLLADADGADRSALQAVVETFARLIDRDEAVAPFVLNAGRQERWMRHAAREAGLQKAITFAEAPSEVQCRRAVTSAHVYILPGESADVGFHPLLAMAGGVAVVAADRAACDFLGEQELCATFPAGQGEELLATVRDLLADPDARETMAEQALQYIRRHHNPLTVSQDMVAFYRDVLGESAASDGAVREET